MISIIVPVYNVQNYILRCLKSIASQTYTGQMECLIIDDCGQDNSINIAEKFIEKYKGNIKFKIIHREKNGGLSAARNTGLKEAKGDYIGFIDSDDWIDPMMYEKLYEKISKSKKIYFVTSCIVAHINSTITDKYAGTDNYKEDEELSPKRFLELMLSCHSNNSPCNKLFRREFITQSFQEGKVCEDYLFLFDNSIKLYNKDVCFITTDKTYYHYIVHDGSITNQDNKSEKQWWIDWMENMAYVADKCKKPYRHLYMIQKESLVKLYKIYFMKIIFNKSLIIKRRRTLSNINRYTRSTYKSAKTKEDKLYMFVATHIPYGYGYMLSKVLFHYNKTLSRLTKVLC